MKKHFLFVVMLFSTSVFFSGELITQTQNKYTKNIKIDPSIKEEISTPLEDATFYQMDFFPGSDEYSLCKIEIRNQKGKVTDLNLINPDQDNHFKLKMFFALDSSKFSIFLQKKGSADFTEYKSFEIKKTTMEKTPVIEYDSKSQITKITIDYTNYNDLPKTITTGKFYLIDINLAELYFESCNFVIYNDDEYFEFLSDNFVAQPDGHFRKMIYAPSTLQKITVALYNSYWYDHLPLLYCKSENTNKKTVLKTPKNSDYKKAKQYLTEKPDERIISYLEEIDARSICHENPNKAIDLCIKKVLALTSDDFEKVKLIHDSIWYLESYDWTYYESTIEDYSIFDELKEQDYYNDLKNGVCVCEGFAKTFSQMCLEANIPCCDVMGECIAFDTDGKIKNIGGHAWNIVMINNAWYLVDLTWDCSQFKDGKRNDFYSSKWLFMKPEEFVKYHYPQCPELQLLKKPVKIKGIKEYFEERYKEREKQSKY